MIERIQYKNQLLSIIIRNSFTREGIEFFTPGDFSQQLGYMNRPSGYKIPPHVHNEEYGPIEQWYLHKKSFLLSLER